jgi:hypothetical protein
MIVKHLGRSLLAGLTWLVCCFLGVLTFGDMFLFSQYVHFDQIIIFVTFISAITFRKNLDILTCLMFVLLAQISCELIFSFSQNTLVWKVAGYLGVAFCLVISKRDSMTKFMIPIFVLSLFSEFYWLYIDYEGPEIYWSLIQLGIYLLARYLIIIRFTLTVQVMDIASYFLSHIGSMKYQKLIDRVEQNLEPIDLDRYLKFVFSIPIVIEGLNVLEYIIRHNTALNPLLIYSIYPYVIQVFGIVTLFVVTFFSHISNQQRRFLA